MQQIDPSYLTKINQPSMIIYQKSLVSDPERNNLESSFSLRDEFEGVKLSPLPCFYMEQLKLLGVKTQINLNEILCSHQLLPPAYHDIYPKTDAVQPVSIGDREIEILEKKRAVKPERSCCVSQSVAFKRLLVGTTMLPSPIVDYILEKVVSH